MAFDITKLSEFGRGALGGKFYYNAGTDAASTVLPTNAATIYFNTSGSCAPYLRAGDIIACVMATNATFKHIVIKTIDTQGASITLRK